MEDFPVEIPEKWRQKANLLGVFADDVEEQFTRGSGKGGQKVNKTSNTVLLRHGPTGISVRCQKHRELTKNRMSAYKLLIDKIEEKILGKESEKAQKVFKLRKQKQKRSKRAKEKILEGKKLRGEVKALRRSPGVDDGG